MLSDRSEYRYGTIKHPYAFWKRIHIWFYGIIYAIKSTPDKYWIEWVILKPGDVGYEDAPFGCIVDTSAPRYRFENGEWTKVDPSKERTEINPDWRTP